MQPQSSTFEKISTNSFLTQIQARIAQLVANRLGTGEVPGTNPSKGENFLGLMITDLHTG